MRGKVRAGLLHAVVQNWTHRGLFAWLLWPVSLLLRALVRFRQGMYLSGVLERYRVPVPVVVVGNVVVGGTGKTPVVIAVIRHLQSRGWHPGVISRGYGRSGRDCREVHTGDSAFLVGDEPALIKRLTQVPVFVAPQRVDAAQALFAGYPHADILISDDGLQHYQLQRDVEICLFDDRGIGNGFLLPAGLLREPWPRPVDLVLHTGSRPAFAGFTSQRRLVNDAIRADGSRLPLTTLAEIRDRPIVAIAAIAQPEVFFSMLRAQGIQLSEAEALPDHHNFENWQRPLIPDHLLLCTEKDAVKLWERYPDVWAIPLEFIAEPSFFQTLDHLLEACERSPVSSRNGHTTF